MKKILLIGDSIRKGYDTYTRLAFEGVAEVYFPKENCRFTPYIIRNLDIWKRDLGLGEDIDLVHFNAGLWDDLRMLDGKPVVDIDTYRENIARICDIINILFPRAKIVFATSTPVREELFGDIKRYNRDTEAYNAAASEVVRERGISVNDLYSLMNALPVEYHSDQTHYYTKEGTEAIADQVIAMIEKELSIKAKPLDYDALFSKANDVIGV